MNIFRYEQQLYYQAYIIFFLWRTLYRHYLCDSLFPLIKAAKRRFIIIYGKVRIINNMRDNKIV